MVTIDRKKQELIEHVIMDLLVHQDMSGYIATRLDCRVVDKPPFKLPPYMKKFTACLAYKDHRFFMYLGYEFFKSLSPEERTAVVKHEVHHFINKHNSRQNSRDDIIWNIATDMAINQDIPGLPKDCVVLPDKWKPNDASEAYYDKLIECSHTKKTPVGCNDLWDYVCPADANNVGGMASAAIGDAAGLADAIIHDIIRERLNAGVDAAHLRGLYAGALADAVDLLTKPPMINWRAALTRFASSLSDDRKRMTLKRPDRRNLSKFGRLREHLPSMIIVVDTSGSVSNELLTKFFSQIAFLGKMLASIEVVIADAEVHDHFKFTPAKTAKLKDSAFGRGGTDFDPAVKYINKNLAQHDGVVYLTDGYCPVPETKCRVPMLWIVQGADDFAGKPQIRVPGDE